jgi:DSF synthase
VSIALVEGISTLGGSFEAALEHHFVLAQSNIRMYFPEIAFTRFHCMGGYSMVAHKTKMRLGEKLILGSESIHRRVG